MRHEPGRWMRAEIGEQPDVVARVVEREAKTAARLGEELRRRGVTLAVLAARGSSDHAAAVGKYLIEWACAVPAALAAPSMATLYATRLKLSGAAVIGVSQSGRSPDVVEYMRMARRAGALTIAITNESRSPLARAADETLLCHAGPERSVAATKTFAAQVAALALIAGAWGQGPRGEGILRGLRRAPALLRRVVRRGKLSAELARRLAAAERCIVLARGFAYPAALETGLKLKESAALAAEGASAADYLHGPVAAAGPGLAALLFGPRGPGLTSLRSAAGKLRAAGAEVLAVTADRAVRAEADYSCDAAGGWPEPLSPLPFAALGQMTAYELALLKGLDPDHPVGLRKVTETW